MFALPLNHYAQYMHIFSHIKDFLFRLELPATALSKITKSCPRLPGFAWATSRLEQAISRPLLASINPSSSIIWISAFVS
ncbi:hypothetical protein ASG50_25145 [Rhizobium sp. Leaf386]|nr:hypothetical protein ASG50_25145 [Rhizobium sp. Leaf386]